MTGCEWVDYGPDMDGTAASFGCNRPAAGSIFETGTDWYLCAEHLAAAQADDEAAR